MMIVSILPWKKTSFDSVSVFRMTIIRSFCSKVSAIYQQDLDLDLASKQKRLCLYLMSVFI